MRKVLIRVMALLAAGALAGCGTSGTMTQDVKTDTTTTTAEKAGESSEAPAEGDAIFTLGLICPLSGSSAVSGQILKNATELAVNEINEAGGINGNIKIVLAQVDDEGVPANSVTAMQKLVEQDKVQAVIGAQASSCTLANMEITKAAKIPQITPASSNVAVTQSGNQYIYQMTATDELHMRNIMKYMAEENDAKTFAILYESSDFGTGGFKIADDVCGTYNLEMAASEVYNSGDTDFSVVLGKMQKADPDFFIFWGYHTEVAMICKQMQQYGISYPVIGQGYNSPELTNLGGNAVEGIMIDTAFDAANPDAKVQEFDKKYTELYGKGYDQNAPQSYDAVYVIKDAVERCIADGKDYTNGEILNEYIASTSWEGVTGVTTFDETGRMDKELLIITIENGEHKIIKD
ncbi:MAG: ABC transporter substrate-binding protein [Lachnospiraceae bacterium]